MELTKFSKSKGNNFCFMCFGCYLNYIPWLIVTLKGFHLPCHGISKASTYGGHRGDMRMFKIFKSCTQDTLLCAQHKSQSENTKYIHEYCLKLADSRNAINILLYFNANADISVPKYTYNVGYWHISTIISVHISEQQHFYR